MKPTTRKFADKRLHDGAIHTWDLSATNLIGSTTGSTDTAGQQEAGEQGQQNKKLHSKIV